MTSAIQRTAARQSFTARLRKLESAFADLAKQFATLATVARESDEALCETFDAELKSRPTSTEVVAMIDAATRPKKKYGEPIYLGADALTDAARAEDGFPPLGCTCTAMHEGACGSAMVADEYETVPTTSEGAE